jgi:hypothetical protein
MEVIALHLHTPCFSEGCTEVEGAKPVSEREVVHWFQTLLMSANISGEASLTNIMKLDYQKENVFLFYIKFQIT